MINESEMKIKKEKNEKWKFVCKPNIALHLKWEIKTKSGLRMLIFGAQIVFERRE